MFMFMYMFMFIFMFIFIFIIIFFFILKCAYEKPAEWHKRNGAVLQMWMSVAWKLNRSLDLCVGWWCNVSSDQNVLT